MMDLTMMNWDINWSRLMHAMKEIKGPPHLIAMQEITKPQDTEYVVQQGYHIYMAADIAKKTVCVTAVRADLARHIMKIDAQRHYITPTIKPPGDAVHERGSADEYKMQRPTWTPTPCALREDPGPQPGMQKEELMKQIRDQNSRDQEVWNALPRQLKPIGPKRDDLTATRVCWRTATRTRIDWIRAPTECYTEGYVVADSSDFPYDPLRPPADDGEAHLLAGWTPTPDGRARRAGPGEGTVVGGCEAPRAGAQRDGGAGEVAQMGRALERAPSHSRKRESKARRPFPNGTPAGHQAGRHG